MKNKKKGLTLLCLILTLVCCIGGAVVLVTADSGISALGRSWEGSSSIWTANDDGTVTGTNEKFTGNLLLTTDENLVGDYAVGATFTGSNNTEVTKEIHYGIVPWYQDSKNFVLIYLQWRPADKFNMINVQMIAFENGVQTPWANHWLDTTTYKNTLYTLNPTDTITVRVEKRLNATATADTYKVTVSADKNGTAISETPATIDFTVSAPHAATQAKAGVYCFNDTLTVSDFKMQTLTDTGVYKSLTGQSGTVGRSTSADGWSYDNETYSVNAESGTALQNQAILKNSYASGSYKFGYTANCTGGATLKRNYRFFLFIRTRTTM